LSRIELDFAVFSQIERLFCRFKRLACRFEFADKFWGLNHLCLFWPRVWFGLVLKWRPSGGGGGQTAARARETERGRGEKEISVFAG